MKQDNMEYPEGFIEFVPPRECAECHKPLMECRGVDDPKMDGLHLYHDEWFCDKCLQELGRRIRDGEIEE